MAQRHHEQMRQRIAQRAAQILIESGNQDFYAAKHKAAEQLGATDTRNLPKNSEIEAEVVAYQRLFRADSQPNHLQHLREVAVKAMNFLLQFKPKLVGAVLRGTADAHSAINLHLFADNVEDVGLYLLDHQIPSQLTERRLKVGHDQQETYAVYKFIAEDVPVELMVFTPKQRQVPLSPVDSRPMQRADITEVELLLQQQ